LPTSALPVVGRVQAVAEDRQRLLHVGLVGFRRYRRSCRSVLVIGGGQTDVILCSCEAGGSGRGPCPGPSRHAATHGDRRDETAGSRRPLRVPRSPSHTSALLAHGLFGAGRAWAETSIMPPPRASVTRPGPRRGRPRAWSPTPQLPHQPRPNWRVAGLVGGHPPDAAPGPRVATATRRPAGRRSITRPSGPFGRAGREPGPNAGPVQHVDQRAAG